MTTAVGVIVYEQTAGEILAANQTVYLKSDGKWWLARANAEATSAGEIAIVIDAAAANAKTRLLKLGYKSNPAWKWTPG